MSIRIYKFNRSTLAPIDYENLSSSSVQTMVLTHTVDCTKTFGNEFPFTFYGAKIHAPYINEEEYCIVIREKVDLTSRGPNDTTIDKIGDDKGQKSYSAKRPYRPVALPPGFVELKGRE